MINFLTIPNELSPKEADSLIKASASSDADSLILLHEHDCDPFCTSYREKLLSLLRAALRHKVKIYLADDSFAFSGTAFSRMASVSDLRAKELLCISSSQLLPEEEPLFEKDGKCVVCRLLPENESYPYNHYPDLTNPESAEMAKDFVYRPFLNEYKKFAGYELCGFVGLAPCFLSPLEEYVPYCREAFERIKSDPFSIFEDEEKKKSYVLSCREAFEKNYLLSLKACCTNKGVSFSVTPYEKKGASKEFCKNESELFNFRFAHGFSEIVSAFSEGAFPVLPVSQSPYFKECARLRKYLSTVPKNIIVNVTNEEITLEGDEILLLNNTNEILSIKINVPENKSFFVKSPEGGSLFNLDGEFEYVFYPFGFMHIISQNENVFSEELPSRLDGVQIRRCADEYEEELSLFTSSFEEASFTLPDEPLFGKLLDIEGDFAAVEVKIGAMSKVLLSPPFYLPLFEFCRGITCSVTCFSGSASNVSLLHKKC